MEERPFCASCDIGYGESFHKYFAETKLVIDLAQEHGLILNTVNCQKCQNPCKGKFEKNCDLPVARQ